jgi:hypothetical protein
MKRCHPAGKNANIVIYQEITEVPDEWDAFLPQEHFLKKDSLHIYQQANLPDLNYYYVLVYKVEKLVFVSAFQALTFRKYHLDTDSLKSWQGTSWGVFAAVVKPKMLVAGHLFRHDISSFYYDEELGNFEAFQLYNDCLLLAAKESCSQAVLIKDTRANFIDYFQHHAPQFIMLRNDISMEMNLPAEWQHIGDYEKALKHKYAQRYRKVRSSWDQLEVKDLDAATVEKEKENIYALYKHVTEHQQVRLGYLSADLLPLLKKNYPATMKIWGIYEDGNLVAFASAWLKSDAFDMFYIGFDYSRNQDLQLYFNILFLSLEKAIEYKKPKLILGRTALEAKARIGCKPHYLHTFLYIRNPILRGIFARMQQNITQSEGEWESRHPLKK